MGKTGDPFKDFQTDLVKVVAPEAKLYIQKGRDACYEFIDLLYRTDWKFYSKYQTVKVYQLQLPGQDLFIRCETKFTQVALKELIQYFRVADKRMAWECHDTIEEVRAFPLNTSLFYIKLAQSGWPSGMTEMFLATHGVELKGGRYYLASTSVDHEGYPV